MGILSWTGNNSEKSASSIGALPTGGLLCLFSSVANAMSSSRSSMESSFITFFWDACVFWRGAFLSTAGVLADGRSATSSSS